MTGWEVPGSVPVDIRNLVNHTRGIDVFFVDSIKGASGFSDLRGNKIVCCALKSRVNTLAHEIGHSLGLKDVLYRRVDSDGNRVILRERLDPETMLEEYDRSGASGMRYYNPNATLASIIARCVMCGNARADGRMDIPFDTVRGWVYVDPINQVVTNGAARVGMHYIHPIHVNAIREERNPDE